MTSAIGREHILCRVDEIASGDHKVFDVGRHGVGVYNLRGTFYAIANYCPHEGGPLCSGRARGRTVTNPEIAGGASTIDDGRWIYCPWHQWGFDLVTGASAVKPEWSIRTYPIRIEDENIVLIM